MTEKQAIDAIHNGRLVECTKEEYESGLRTAIQDQAGKWIDQGYDARASIALSEVRRLDSLFAAKETGGKGDDDTGAAGGD